MKFPFIPPNKPQNKAVKSNDTNAILDAMRGVVPDLLTGQSFGDEYTATELHPMKIVAPLSPKGTALGGRYSAKSFGGAVANSSVSGNLSELHFGTVETEVDCEYWYPPEFGLSANTIPADSIVFGKLVCHGTSEGGGKPVFASTEVRAIVPVALTSDGGAAGTASVAPTYTYSLKALDKNGASAGVTFATAKTPIFPRPIGLTSAATFGFAMLCAGVATLIYAHEVDTTGAC